MRKAFKFRLSPTSKQEEKLFWTLAACRELYNAGLSERRDAYEMCVRRHPNYYDESTRKALTKEHAVTYTQQQNDLPEIKSKIREEYQDIHSQVLQDVLRRLDKAMDAFFRRVKNGEKPGYPRFQGKNRFNSFTYSQSGYTLSEKHVTLSKLGTIKCKFHRAIEGKIKTATIKYEAGQWYVIFSCDIAEVHPKLPYTDEAVGIDLGLLHFATLSTGDTLENPRYFRKAQADLKRKQRHLSRCKRGSHRCGKARKQVAFTHRKIRNQRQDFLHKQSSQLVATYQTVVFEEIQINNISKAPRPKQDAETGQYLPNGASAKAGLNKSILDAGWGIFVSMCRNKAACAGTTVATVSPYKTSQICSECGKEGPHKDLSERQHICVHCGVVLDRDHNAARNILSAWERPTYWRSVCAAGRHYVEAPCL